MSGISRAVRVTRGILHDARHLHAPANVGELEGIILRWLSDAFRESDADRHAESQRRYRARQRQRDGESAVIGRHPPSQPD